ncbi:hypothetical protein FVR03_20210 [Pontibacter qinzhouensis]|uniref:Uncharacterized protein n=1 Tax=Pontibacter qinzhouensis TaxID=2603253 RepID=A0A5C8J3U1_9BACT|nr:hypothetical protein [Pontibacter qinzhouensis]TXK30867.1 hypothetical protein FVR03_20210 [Pontibacter qinzhouensis]
MYQQDKTAFKHISRTALQMATDINLKHMYAEEVNSDGFPCEVVFCVIEDKMMAVLMSQLVLLGWYESSHEEKTATNEACSGNYYLHLSTNKVLALEHSVLDEFCIAKFVDKGVFDVVSQIKYYRLKELNMPFLRKLKIAQTFSIAD